MQGVVNIKTKKLCLLTQFSGKVLVIRNVIVSYTEDCVNKGIVTTVAHSQPMAGKKDWLD